MPETISVPEAGTALPDIPLVLADGTSARLAEQIAGRPAVIFFMRAADCAICAAHGRALERMAAAGELGDARAIVIAPGDAAAARTAAARIRGSHLAVAASGEHHADLGLGRFLMLQHSGTFVTDADGRIIDAVTSALPTASFSAAKVRAVLDALGRSAS